MRKWTQKWALLVAAAILAGQLVAVFHAHEAEAAADEHPCSICQLTESVKTFDEATPQGEWPLTQEVTREEARQQHVPSQLPLIDCAPRAPPYLISL